MRGGVDVILPLTHCFTGLMSTFTPNTIQQGALGFTIVSCFVLLAPLGDYVFTSVRVRTCVHVRPSVYTAPTHFVQNSCKSVDNISTVM